MGQNKSGLFYLQEKLESKRPRVVERYSHYAMKETARDFQISTPPNLEWFKPVLGWCGKAVDSLADRLIFIGFDNDELNIEEIYRGNNPDILLDSAIISAVIASCDFIYISKRKNGMPRLQVIDAGNATGTLNQITGLLEEGYAVLERDENDNVVLEAYFTPHYTAYYRGGRLIRTDSNPTGYPLLVPIIYRPDAVREFGRSRISRACISLTDSAMRTIKRAEISSEFYSFPQKYVLGLSQDHEPMSGWKAAMSAMLDLGMDRDGNMPKVGQFQQASMEPHINHVRMLASLFSGETGLTLDDLGFPGDNPSSADAIKSAHETLRLTAKKAQRCLGAGLLNAGFVAACLRDGKNYSREKISEIRPKWEPTFEPDAGTMSQIGDAAIKINQAVPGYFDKENMRRITGVAPGDGDSE